MANVRFSNGMRLASVYIASRTLHACMFQPMTATHYPTSSRFPSDFFELFDNIDMLHSNRHTHVCNVKCRFLNEHYFSPQTQPFRDACVDVGSGDARCGYKPSLLQSGPRSRLDAISVYRRFNVVQLSPAAIGALAARTCRAVSSTIERRVLMDMATAEDIASPHNESR